MYVDSSRTYIGIVEENEDPKKLGRCRIRVIDIFDDIPKDDIPWATPWKDLNGNAFNLPEKGKIVTVIFDSGNIYKPEYIYADHYNINLEKKLSQLSGANYTSMKSLIFDHKTQIFVNDGEGLVIDHKMNQINITSNSIHLNLKDNNSSINLGHESANQQAILGTNFLNWFDDFVANLLGERGGPYLGNLGAPVVCNPDFIECLQKYRALKDPKFLSHNVNLNDNKLIDSSVVKLQRDRIQNGQVGDTWKNSKKDSGAGAGAGGAGSGSGGGVGSGGGSTEPIDFEPKASVPLDGNLTTASGADSGSNVPLTEPKSIPPASQETNDDGEYILSQLKRLGYTVYTRPYEMNIVGIRYQVQGMEYSNRFVDRIYLIYKNDQNATKAHWYPISTIPGAYAKRGGALHKDLGKMKERGGLGTLAPAQYKDSWTISSHGGEKALRPSKQKFYRDTNFGVNKITYSKSGEGYAGMLIHKAFNRKQGKNTYGVFNWSEGCQVIQDPTSLDQIFNLLEIHRGKYGNKFTYTLITKNDVPKLG